MTRSKKKNSSPAKPPAVNRGAGAQPPAAGDPNATVQPPAPGGDNPPPPPPAPTPDKKDKKSPDKKGAERFYSKAKEVFKNHAVENVYFTDDETAFLEPQHARMHAESLKVKDVTPVNKKEV